MSVGEIQQAAWEAERRAHEVASGCSSGHDFVEGHQQNYCFRYCSRCGRGAVVLKAAVSVPTGSPRRHDAVVCGYLK
jgi:hypothetical protein